MSTNYLEIFVILQIMGIMIFYLEREIIFSIIESREYFKIFKILFMLNIPNLTLLSLYIRPL